MLMSSRSRPASDRATIAWLAPLPMPALLIGCMPPVWLRHPPDVSLRPPAAPLSAAFAQARQRRAIAAQRVSGGLSEPPAGAPPNVRVP